MKLISPYYKAVVAAVSLIGTMLVTASTNPNITSVLPVTAAGWLATAGTVVGGTVLTWLVRNQPTVEQAEKLLADARDRAGV